jgi:hypothetical protein
VLCDFLAQKFVSFIRRISAERVAMREFFDGTMHGVDRRAWQRFRDIANAAADESLGCFRRCVGKRFYAACNLRKKIAGLKLEVILV